MHTLTPDNINSGITNLNRTQDSLTIFDDCGIFRDKYDVFENYFIFGTVDQYKLLKIPEDELDQQYYFEQFELSIKLPIENTATDSIPINPRPVWIGNELSIIHSFCSNDSLILEELEIEDVYPDSLENPFQTAPHIKFKYGGEFFEPKHIQFLKKSLITEIPESQTLSIIFFADKEIPDSTFNKIVHSFSEPRIDLFRACIKRDALIDFGYLKIK